MKVDITDGKNIGENCGIALAVRDIFPKANVESAYIEIPDGCDDRHFINLPDVARDFIELFDSLKLQPEKRLSLPELTFEVWVQKDVIDLIGLEEVHKILKESKTLELV